MYKKNPNKIVFDPNSMAEFIDIADDIAKMIFAPDPVTGLPQNDIKMFKSSMSPEIAAYVQSNLLKPITDNSVGFQSPDEAINSLRQVGESINDYAERLNGYFNDAREQTNQQNDNTATDSPT